MNVDIKWERNDE